MKFEVGFGRVLPNNTKETGQMRVITVPTGDEQDRYRAACDNLKRVCDTAVINASLEKKAGQVSKALERMATRRTAPIHSMPGTASLSELARSPGPSAGQLAAQWQAAYAAHAAQICAESEAAYAARNPHKKERK